MFLFCVVVEEGVQALMMPISDRSTYIHIDRLHPLILCHENQNHHRKEHDAPWNRYMHFTGTTLAVLQLVRDPPLLIAGLVSVGTSLRCVALILSSHVKL